MPALRPLYTRADLERTLAPRSIAVVGASERPGSLGRRTLDNLSRFEGAVYCVNAKGGTVLGRRCYDRLAALPEVPDCAVLAIPAGTIERAVEDCARLGVGGAVIFAAGFAELGTEAGRGTQARMVAVARSANLRLIGPNSTGYANHVTKAHAAFAEFAACEPRERGTIGLVTQSGGLGLGLSAAVEAGLAFSHVLSCGNSCDVDIADYVAWLAGEPACQAIACLFEGLFGEARLLDAVKIARQAGKRVVLTRLATTAAGTEAASRHTATRAGLAHDLDSLLERAGAFSVSFERLLETASFFAKAPASPVATGVAILASTGGGGILVADAVDRHGVPLPAPAAATRERLRAAIPDFGVPGNPCDMTANATSNHSMIEACALALLDDPAYGALVIPVSRAINVPLFRAIAAAAQASEKILCVVWMSGRPEGSGTFEFETDPNLALFRSAESCIDALRVWLTRPGP